MSGHLVSLLERGHIDVRRFLDAATATETIDLDQIIAAGTPAYEARNFVQRLQRAGEIDDDTWNSDSLALYRRMLQTIADQEDAETQNPKRLQRAALGERPRERAERLGISALSDSELIALLLRTGSGSEGVIEFAERLLLDHDGLVGLAGHDVAELIEARGMGPAKAAELAAAFELGRRLAQARRRDRPSMRTPEEVVTHLQHDLPALRHEELWCLPLDVRSRLIGEPRTVSRGDVDGTEAGPRVFFRTALRAGAVSVIAVHNHPSGDCSPSQADLAVRRRLVAAGRTIDVTLVDHLIVGDGGRFTSLRRTHPDLFGSH